MLRHASGPIVRNGRRAFIVVMPLIALIAGCGRRDGLVDASGTVLLDGKPLPDAIVQFTAASYEGKGYARPATGRTDASGHYHVEYSTQVTGLKPGAYRVSVSTYYPSTLTNEEKLIPGAPELVPEVYNSKSTLTADVKEDGQTFDFDLKSSAGKVVQPDAPRGK